jgi:membrane protease YdiL (CAAX protease family)
VYEETLFRFLLLGGIVLALHRGLGGEKFWVVPLAVAVSALLFSWAHHVPGGEPWDTRVFAFRAAMGALLGWVYLARGLGIVVYAHALYNVVLALERARHV